MIHCIVQAEVDVSSVRDLIQIIPEREVMSQRLLCPTEVLCTTNIESTWITPKICSDVK